MNGMNENNTWVFGATFREKWDAFVLALEQNKQQRVIYITPFKTTAHHWFYQLRNTFLNKLTVGIWTGEHYTNVEPTTQVLIVIAEIAANAPPSLFDNVGCIMLDDCHFIMDKGSLRGGVWSRIQSTIPSSIPLRMFSVPVNDSETHHETCQWNWLQSSNHNALKYHVYCDHSNRLVAVDDMNEMDVEFAASRRHPRYILNNLLFKLFKQHSYATTEQIIIYVSSRRQVEDIAPKIKIPPCSRNDDTHLESVCELYLSDRLTNYRDYWELSCCRELMESIKRGVAYYHSGMIPVLKELVEWLVSQRKVKIVVSTESFSIVPFQEFETAIFLSLNKHDGDQWRLLKPSELSQMTQNIVHDVVVCNMWKPLTRDQGKEIQSPIYSQMISVIDRGATTVSRVDAAMNPHTSVLVKLRAEWDSLSSQSNHLPTKWEDMTEYALFRKRIKDGNLSPKEYKEIVRKMKEWTQDHRFGLRDIVVFEKMQELATQISTIENEMQCMSSRIRSLWNAMIQDQMLEATDSTDEYRWSTSVVLCREMNPFIVPHFYNVWRDEPMTAKEWAKLLSCFAVNVTKSPNRCVKEEECRRTSTIVQYLDSLGMTQSSWNDHQWECLVAEWCDCHTPQQRREFIESLEDPGDFIKVAFKIVAISREIFEMAKKRQDEGMMETLSGVSALLFKHVVSPQSLFVR